MKNRAAALAFLSVVVCAPLGCRKETVPVSPTGNASPSAPDHRGDAEVLNEVRRIAAELMNTSPAQVHASSKLSEVGGGMDELDLVELIMELEDHYDIYISDDSLSAHTGTTDPGIFVSNLTIGRIAEAASAELKKKGPKAIPK